MDGHLQAIQSLLTTLCVGLWMIVYLIPPFLITLLYVQDAPITIPDSVTATNSFVLEVLGMMDLFPNARASPTVIVRPSSSIRATSQCPFP